MIISLRPCWGFVKGICHMSLFSKNMYFENSVCQWIWKTTLNIHQLKNNKYKQSHNHRNAQTTNKWNFLTIDLLCLQSLKFLDPWLRFWFDIHPIILMVSPVWLSFLCPWTLLHLVHHHWHILSSILSWPLVEILIWYPSSSWIILMVSPKWLSFLPPGWSSLS